MMKSLIAAGVGFCAASLAAPASALALYEATGSLFLVLEADSGIEASVEYTISDGTDEVTSGTATAFSFDDLLDDGVGVTAQVFGSSDAPGGSSTADLFLDVAFTLTNTNPVTFNGVFDDPASYQAMFFADIEASASATLPGELSDAQVAVTGTSGFTGSPGEFVESTESLPPETFEGLVASVEGDLFAGGPAVTYRFIFDLTGMAETPLQPGTGAEVPLPAAGALMIVGLGALAAARRRRKS